MKTFLELQYLNVLPMFSTPRLREHRYSTVMFQENVKLCIFQSKNDMNVGFKYIKRTLFFSYSSKKKRLNFTDIPHYQNEIKLKFKSSFSIEKKRKKNRREHSFETTFSCHFGHIKFVKEITNKTSESILIRSCFSQNFANLFKSKYDNSLNTTCRACGSQDETIEHISSLPMLCYPARNITYIHEFHRHEFTIITWTGVQ